MIHRQLIKLNIILMTAFFGAILASAEASQKASIIVNPNSEVPGASISLGEIAEIQSADSALTDSLKSAAICPSPLPGKSRKLTKDYIITALRRAGLYDDSLAIISGKEIHVTRLASIVSGDALFEAASEHIINSQEWQGEVFIEPVRLPAEQIAPVGEIEFRARENINGIRKGRGSIAVEILVDNQVARTVHVPVLVKLLAKVPVAMRAINRGEELTFDNITIEQRDITFMPEDVVIGEPDPNWIAVLPISEGAVLRQNWVAFPPDVRSGSLVTVVVEGSAVRVAEEGVAAQDGRIGDRVRVRLSGKNREVRGRVAGPNMIHISIDRRR